jgi:hypothetical protein
MENKAMSRCMACNIILKDKDFIIDEQGELCQKCLGIVHTDVYPLYPIETIENEEDE